MKIDLGVKDAVSWGNGILRISLKDVIIIVGALLAAGGVWQDLKSQGKTNASEIAAVKKAVAKVGVKVDGVQAEVGDISDRVLVLETMQKVTAEIRNRVKRIQSEEVFDEDVTNIKVKR